MFFFMNELFSSQGSLPVQQLFNMNLPTQRAYLFILMVLQIPGALLNIEKAQSPLVFWGEVHPGRSQFTRLFDS